MWVYLSTLGLSAHLMAVTDIELWHAFDGPLAETFTEIVEDFNHHSGNYRVVLVKKDNYAKAFEQGIEAFKTGTHPHILQIYEVATLTAMMTNQVFKPVDQLMSAYHKKFDPDVYIDSVRHFYSNAEGKMMSLPWNASTGILFYNKKAFVEAGLDPEKPPKTWQDLEKIAIELKKKGFKGYTTAWPAAYHLEHVCSWHNLPFATAANGFNGLSARLTFNQQPEIFHISKVVEWIDSGTFTYAGRFGNEPEKLFADQTCAILLQGANRLPLLQKQAPFPIGVGFMPYWPQIAKEPFNLNIGGASFWVMSGFKDEEYRGIVQFFEYLSSTEIQAFWHQKTGYLPITDAAYYLTKKKGFYKDHPAAEVAVLSVMGPRTTANTKGIRLGDYVQVRDVIIENLEKAFNKELTPKEALDNAVKEGNLILESFEKEHTATT